MKRSQLFVVGRKTTNSTTVVVIGPKGRSPIPGPWTVRAVVKPTAAR